MKQLHKRKKITVGVPGDPENCPTLRLCCLDSEGQYRKAKFHVCARESNHLTTSDRHMYDQLPRRVDLI